MNIPYVFKKCSKCGEWLVANRVNFRKSKNAKYGLYNYCIECNNKDRKQYYQEHKEETLQYMKQYREEHKEETLQYNKQYNQKHKEERQQYMKQYHQEHKEERQQYYQENKEGILQYMKQYHQTPQGKQTKAKYAKSEKGKQCYIKYYKSEKGQITLFNGNHKRRQHEEKQGSGITPEQWRECNEWFGWKCAYSGEKLENNSRGTHGRTLDHIIALDNGGEHEIWNLVPMRKGYNSSKHNNNNWIEWYKQQPYFSEQRLQRILDWMEYAYNKWSNTQEAQ